MEIEPKHKLLSRHKRTRNKQLGAYYSNFMVRMLPPTDWRLNQISRASSLSKNEVVCRLIDMSYRLNKEKIDEIINLQNKVLVEGQAANIIENIQRKGDNK
jgi:N-acyl-L-homoserine lactone synthetase